MRLKTFLQMIMNCRKIRCRHTKFSQIRKVACRLGRERCNDQASQSNLDWSMNRIVYYPVQDNEKHSSLTITAISNKNFIHEIGKECIPM